MANNHGYCSLIRATAWDVDSNKLVGIATTDMDNGTFVILTSMNVDTNKNINGFEYKVTAATAASTSVWVVRTPEAGTDMLEVQLYDDPRYFYNKAGKPMSLAYMNPHVDHIEVDKNCFTANFDPETVTGATMAQLDANGKLKAVTSAPASGAYFTIVGKHSIAVGQELVPTWVLRCERN